MEDYFNSLEQSLKTKKQLNMKKIKSAYEFAYRMHDGQKRQSGEAYICHPVAVAEIAGSLDLDTDSICAALLHDTVEDCSDKTNLLEIEKLFGKTVSELVDGLTKIKLLKVLDKEEEQYENIRKMLFAMNKDIRVIFVKLCDRLHNMRTLDFKSEDRQRSISLETMYVYAPIAHRLGMQKIKVELENLSLKYLDPIGYEEVINMVDLKYGKSINLIENAKQTIRKLLIGAKIPFEIEARTKSTYSLYRKIYTLGKTFDEIYDFYALRIIVNTELECYTVLGLIHEAFKSMPGRFKDYVSTPKPNLYRSLHTTVMGRDGIPFEVQIRTHEMHEIAEYGIAAHWKYKSGDKANAQVDEKLRWISSLIDNTTNTENSEDFLEAFKTDIFHDETFVFTPKGDIISLPAGSTVIDFAYAIHSAVGNKMIGAKINGKIATIDSIPQNGDIVEILTVQNGKGPSRDWLKIVKTSEARNKIRTWFKKEKREENIVLGRDMVESEIKRLGRTIPEKVLLEVCENIARTAGITTGVEDFFSTLGYGGLAISKISKSLKDEIERVAPQNQEVEQKVTLQATKSVNKKVSYSRGVVVDGQTGCEVKFAKCCNPLPGDSIVGFITKGFGISIHKSLCSNVLTQKSDPTQADRWIEAHWELGDNEVGNALYEACLTILIQNRIGTLAKITALMADMRVSILDMNAKNVNDDTGLVRLSVGCKNVAHLETIISKIRNLDFVIEVSRGATKK